MVKPGILNHFVGGKSQDDKDGRTFRVTLIIFLLTIHGTNVNFHEVGTLSDF